jgi:hypothetical protein
VGEEEGKEVKSMKRRVAAALFASLLALATMAPAALADPDCRGAAGDRNPPCKPDGKFSGPK